MHKGEKMNRQRKVVITTTYNELGIIVDTKAEELDLSAQPEPHWISCSKGLPEKGGLYLVTLKRFSEAEICIRYFNKGTDGDFWSGCWGNTRVLAWMPLPKSYGGEP